MKTRSVQNKIPGKDIKEKRHEGTEWRGEQNLPREDFVQTQAVIQRDINSATEKGIGGTSGESKSHEKSQGERTWHTINGAGKKRGKGMNRERNTLRLTLQVKNKIEETTVKTSII